MSIASPLVQPSPNGRRVGIRIVTFEACSGFTHVTARRIAQPPYGVLCHPYAREGQAVVCPLLRGSSPTRWVAPKPLRVPQPDSCTAAYSDYFDHFVGADFLEQRFNAHRFMGSDDQV